MDSPEEDQPEEERISITFDDSTELIRQMREERTKELNEQ